jgi:hypothetical protein
MARSLDCFLCSDHVVRLTTLSTSKPASMKVIHALKSCLEWSGMMLWGNDSVAMDKLLLDGGTDMICVLISALALLPHMHDAKGIHYTISRFLFVVVSLRVDWVCEIIGLGRHEQVVRLYLMGRSYFHLLNIYTRSRLIHLGLSKLISSRLSIICYACLDGSRNVIRGCWRVIIVMRGEVRRELKG